MTSRYETRAVFPDPQWPGHVISYALGAPDCPPEPPEYGVYVRRDSDRLIMLDWIADYPTLEQAQRRTQALNSGLTLP